MKKLFALAVAALFCTAINAQVVTATKYTKAKNKTQWYVKAGMNISGMSGDAFEDFGSIVGYNIGIGFDSPIGTSGLFWSSGLSLATKGCKFDESYSESNWSESYEVKFNLNKLEIPLTIGYKYKIDNDWTVDARFGAFVNYDLWGKMTVEYTETDYGETYTEKYEENVGDFDGWNRVGAGLLIGIGGWWQNLNLSLTYEFGLINQLDDEYSYYDEYYYGGGGGKEHNFMISVAYAF